MSDRCIKCAWTEEFYKNVSRNVEILSNKMGFYLKKQSGPPPQSSTLKGIEFDLKVTWQTQGCGTLSALCVGTHMVPCAHSVQRCHKRTHSEDFLSVSPLAALTGAGSSLPGSSSGVSTSVSSKGEKNSKNKHMTHCLSRLNWLLISWLVLLMSWLLLIFIFFLVLTINLCINQLCALLPVLCTQKKDTGVT